MTQEKTNKKPKKMVIIQNSPVKRKKDIPAKKKGKPEAKPLPKKKAAMRTEKEIKMEILQSVLAEYQREVYFNKKEQAPVLVLNCIQTGKDGEECYEPVQVFMELQRESMQDIRIILPKEPDKSVTTTLWKLVENAVNAEDYRVSSYEYTTDMKKGETV